VHSRELFAYLVKRGATVTHASGSHVRVRLPNGTHVGYVAMKDQVSAVVLRGIATGLGMTYKALREALGHPIQAKGKPRAGCAAAPAAKPASKADVRRTASALRDELRYIETDATGRDRDPAVYARAHRTMLAALKALGAYRNADATLRRTAR
jgi:hypothetical protein